MNFRTQSHQATTAENSIKGILSGLCLSRATASISGKGANPGGAPVIEFGPKTVIFVEGTAADTLFEVQSGAVLLYKVLLDGRRQITGFAYPGDLFGLSGHEDYSYSAQSTGAVRLFAVSRARFNNARSSRPGFDARLFAAIGEDLRRAQDHILLLGRKTAIERLSSFFLGIWQQTGATEMPPSPIVHLPISRGDMADYLGLTVETISRTLAELKDRKIIRLRTKDDVEILDLDALEDMAAGDEMDEAV
jgi:CRP/FNR family transcriptional regulator